MIIPYGLGGNDVVKASATSDVDLAGVVTVNAQTLIDEHTIAQQVRRQNNTILPLDMYVKARPGVLIGLAAASVVVGGVAGALLAKKYWK